jgi:hypothetical protein
MPGKILAWKPGKVCTSFLYEIMYEFFVRDYVRVFCTRLCTSFLYEIMYEKINVEIISTK